MKLLHKLKLGACLKPRSVLIHVVLVALFLPQCAWANAGTPLMWAGMLHLVFGNALIGLGEGLLLAWLSSLPKWKCIWVMILANYASAWIGMLFISAIVHVVPMDLNNGWRWFWILVMATYCMTLVLEWPFIAWRLRGTQGWFLRSVRANLVVQTASYVLLFGWYWLASGTSLYTRMHVVPPAEISLPQSVIVYYLGPVDGSVYRRPLVGGAPQKICDLPATDRNDRLFVRPSTPDTNCWDLVARLETRDSNHPRLIPVLTNLLVEAVPDWRGTHTDPPQYEGTSWSNYGVVQPLEGITNSQWEFSSGFWAVEGLRASNKATGEQVHFSYETPFGAWTVRNVVQLPSDKVLFQLGTDQICVFDPVSRRVALLWHGRGPVAVIAKAKVQH